MALSLAQELVFHNPDNAVSSILESGTTNDFLMSILHVEVELKYLEARTFCLYWLEMRTPNRRVQRLVGSADRVCKSGSTSGF